MITFLYSEKSCTLYKHYKYKNTGSDEVLELENDVSSNGSRLVSRILIKYNLSSIKPDPLQNNQYFLNLKVTQKTELENNSKIELYPIYGTWEEGKGRFADNEVDYSGASWEYRDSSLAPWNNSDTSVPATGGGAWYSEVTNDLNEKIDISANGWFKNEFADLRVNVTNIVNHWLYSGLENNGFIIKYANESDSRSGNVKFFSRSTNTIYYPYLEVLTSDYEFAPCKPKPKTKIECIAESDSSDSGSLDSGSLDSGSLDSGSLDSGSLDSGSLSSTEYTMKETSTVNQSNLTQVDSDEIIAKIKKVKKEYSVNSVEKIRVGVREQHPQKKFEKRARYNASYFTTCDMSYSVRDSETEEIIINFGDYTRISCDSKGHYFNFDFGCLSIGRMYKFLIKLDSDESSEITKDERTFKVVY